MDRDREAFEAHIHARTVWNLCRDEADPTVYELPKTQEAWQIWQAALAYVREGVEPVADTTLTRAQEVALKEISRWKGIYWHRKASMKRLCEIGFVEALPDPHSGHVGVNGPWRITDAGRRALAEHERGG
jgi:hypothetical protein